MTAPSLRLRNAQVPVDLVADPVRFGGVRVGDCLSGDLLVEAGRVIGLAPAGAGPGPDLAGRLVLPRLVEAHCHLDKCHTIARMGAVGGDLHAAIEAQALDKRHWTAADLRARAERGLAELYAAGCAVVRTHVDWDAEAGRLRHPPLAWTVLGELAEAWADRLLLQRAALLSVEAFADGAAAAAARWIAGAPGGVLGVFVFNQPEKRRWLRTAIELAAHHNLPLDFHVDEGLADGLDGLEAIADLVLETGFAGQVLCGHVCSLMNLTGADLERVLAKVAAAGLSVVSLPTTNLYLQDRQAGTPQRRGLTRIRELTAVGVPVAVGCDNVGDAFCPLGAHDPLAALGLAALTGHLDPPYGRWLALVTTTARRALGLAPHTVDGAALAELLVAEADHTAAVVAGAARRPLAQWVAGQRPPDESKVSV